MNNKTIKNNQIAVITITALGLLTNIVIIISLIINFF